MKVLKAVVALEEVAHSVVVLRRRKRVLEAGVTLAAVVRRLEV